MCYFLTLVPFTSLVYKILHVISQNKEEVDLWKNSALVQLEPDLSIAFKSCTSHTAQPVSNQTHMVETDYEI